MKCIPLRPWVMTSLWAWSCRLILAITLLLSVTSSALWKAETAPAIPDEIVRVIVQRADATRAAETFARSLGGEILADLHLINAFVALMPRQALPLLATHPGVRWVSVDGPLASHSVLEQATSDPNPENTYLLSAEVLGVWGRGFQGDGITVAVVDSGVERHTAQGAVKSDFGRGKGSRLRMRISTSSVDRDPQDRYGHGTAVAGIIGGDGAVSKGRYVGVAPGVNLVSVKVGGNDGTGYESDVIAGLQWVYDHRDRYGIRVVNLSVTAATPQSYHTSPLAAAAEVLWLNGIVVVVAAGNNGTLYPPANDPFVITVGAVDERGTSTISDDVIPDWSSWGTDEAGRVKPDLVAPGRRLITTLAPRSLVAISYPESIVADHYVKFSGTSAAAAVVSGAVALMLQEEPNLTPDQIKARLWQSARPLNDERAGRGYLTVAGALDANTNESANAGVQISAFLTPPQTPVYWNGVNWGGVNWGGVNWGGVNWGGVNWGGVNWGGVNWGGVNWGANFGE
ncbi:MAG: S8 family serine peptidase [Anaerolineae bacterium]|nr:S8 family serine peptidase [Anaerolineae bacterium]MDW8100795.1 S8 family serine peptidase [Anaerolineae bacterium]